MPQRLWLTVGLILALGAAPVPEAAAQLPWCHIVRRGESLARIARQAHTSSDRLRRLNAVGPGAPVRPGDILALPAIESLTQKDLTRLAIPIRANRGHRARENGGADADGLSRIRNRAVLNQFVRLHLLVPVPVFTRSFYVVGVPSWRRVSRPWALIFLRQLGAAVNALFGGRLRVTDLTRTEAVQRALEARNANAATARGPLASTHLTGAALDLSKIEHSEVEIAWLRIVLHRLTTQRLIEAIEEFAQPHFHVLVLRSFRRYAAHLRAASAIGC